MQDRHLIGAIRGQNRLTHEVLHKQDVNDEDRQVGFECHVDGYPVQVLIVDFKLALVDGLPSGRPELVYLRYHEGVKHLVDVLQL